MYEFITVTAHNGEGLGETVDNHQFSVLLLNFLPRLQLECIADMQKHMETEECFILLGGKAVLFAADGKEKPQTIQGYPLEKDKIYTVPRGIWHASAMTPEAKILLVENSGTVVENSPRCPITKEQIATIRQWSKYLD